MKRFSFIAVFALFCTVAQQALASGFQIPEQGAKAMGLANAFTAVADDASATWYNPAGLAFQDGSQLMVGADVIYVPGTDFTANANNPATTGRIVSSSSQTVFPPFLYASYKPTDSSWALAVGVNAPFGLKVSWPTTSAFASKATFSKIEMLNINPVFVWKISDNLSIAGGFTYYNVTKVNLNSSIQKLSADGTGYGGNAAVLYKSDQFSIGVSYRSRVDVNLAGTAVGQGALAAAGTSAATSSVTFPDMVNVGIAFDPWQNATLSLEGDWVNWKSFKRIEVDYSSATYRAVLNAASGSTRLVLPENWKAKVAFRAGLEWRYGPAMRARFGYSFDPTPVNDPDFTPAIPDSDRHLFAVGYGYDVTKDATIDVAYMFVYFTKRDQTASTGTNAVKNGSYKSLAHLVGINATWRF